MPCTEEKLRATVHQCFFQSHFPAQNYLISIDIFGPNMETNSIFYVEKWLWKEHCCPPVFGGVNAYQERCLWPGLQRASIISMTTGFNQHNQATLFFFAFDTHLFLSHHTSLHDMGCPGALLFWELWLRLNTIAPFKC